MSTITNYNRNKHTLKYSDNRRNKPLKLEGKLSIGSLAIYMRPIDFPYLLRSRLGFFNTGLLYGRIIAVKT